MRTTSRLYKFALFFDHPIPGFTDKENCHRFKLHCKSLRSAENYLQKTADILSRHEHPTRGVIEYRTQKGLQTREIVFSNAD